MRRQSPIGGDNRNAESATAVAAEGPIPASPARGIGIERTDVAPATPALRTSKRSRVQQRRRAKEAKLPAQERAALQAVPSFDRAVRAASPETRAAMFHEERERKKRVRLLLSPDYCVAHQAWHIRRVDEPLEQPTRAQVAQRRRRQAEAAAVGILKLPPDVFTPARCDRQSIPISIHARQHVHMLMHMLMHMNHVHAHAHAPRTYPSRVPGFPRRPWSCCARHAGLYTPLSTLLTSERRGSACNWWSCRARAFARRCRYTAA